MQSTNKKPLSEAQRRAVAKYNAKAYERIEMKVKKGEKAVIMAHAETMGETLNGFLNRAVKETIKRDSAAQGCQPGDILEYVPEDQPTE